MDIAENFSLKRYNTFNVEAAARYFAAFDSVDTLREALSEAQHKVGEKRVLILGGGSNLLFTRDYDGYVLKNEIRGIELVGEDAEYSYVRAGAGENWHQLVLHCLRHQYAGLENLSLIPGCVGASPIQNIGAYGVELKDVFASLQALNVHDLSVHTFAASDCAFGYRESVFKREYENQFVILNVTLRLNKRPVFHTSYGAIEQELEAMGVRELSIAAIAQAVMNIRRSKLPDPREIGNAGSFFKNPVLSAFEIERLRKINPAIPVHAVNGASGKVPAGWLIEQAGWKGYSAGDAGVHDRQALVLVNRGGAGGQEIYDLSEKIVQSVREKFGVQLEREVNIV
jgi:UDP-N-acetylmuramate dehydrogenase